MNSNQHAPRVLLRLTHALCNAGFAQGAGFFRLWREIEGAETTPKEFLRHI
jgi:hypothetical protein